MKTFLRCKCWKLAGKKRTERVSGCDHKRAFQFRDGKLLPPKMTPYRDKLEADRYADRYRENYFRVKHGRTIIEDDTASAFQDEARTGKTVRLGDLVARFETWVAANHPSCLRRYPQVCKTLVAVLGAERLIHTITPSDLETWKEARLATPVVCGRAVHVEHPKITNPRFVAKTTVNSDRSVIQALFRQAMIWYGIRSPFTPIIIDGKMKSPVSRYPDVPKRIIPVVPLSPEDVLRCVEEFPEPYGLLVRMTYEALPRIGALMTIEKTDVGIDRAPDRSRYGWLRQRLKGGRTKTVGIPIALAETLLARAKTVPADERRLFWDTVKPSGISSKMCSLFRKVGLKVSHHWLRHTGITTMKSRRDVNDADIVELAGWNGPKQLGTYNHTQQHGVIRAAEGNAAFLVGARKKRARKRMRIVAGGAA